MMILMRPMMEMEAMVRKIWQRMSMKMMMMPTTRMRMMMLMMMMVMTIRGVRHAAIETCTITEGNAANYHHPDTCTT